VKHLPRSLADFTYRFNSREIQDMFAQVLKRTLDQKRMKFQEFVSSNQ
jgi:hypothetical protein